MKKLKIFYLLLGCLLTFAACSEDDYSPAVSPLKVTESSVDFNAKGGDGEITVSSTTPIASVVSSEEWCKVSTDGDYKVKVSVGVNGEVYTRNSVVTIKDQSGNETKIAVTQSGLLFYLDAHRTVSADAASISYMKLVHSNEVTLEVDEDATWLKASMQGDSLVLTTEENNTGNVRSAYVWCYSGPRKDSLLVTQGETKDVLGDYYFAGTNTQGEVRYILGNLSEGTTSGTLKLSFPKLNAGLEVPYDEDNLKINFSAGQYVGDWVETDEETEEETTSYIYTVLWDTGQGYITWSTAYSLDGLFMGDTKSRTMVQFADNGSWSGYTIDAIRFEIFSTKVLSSASRKDALVLYIDPFMLKMDESSSDARKNSFAPAKLSILK